MTKLLCRDQFTFKCPRLSLLPFQKFFLALLFILILNVCLHQGLASRLLSLLSEFVREEASNKWTSRLSFVWYHIVAANLGSILDSLKGILRISSSVVKEKLLDTGRLVLMFDIRLTGKEADSAQLITDNKGLAITTELAIEWVVPHVSVNRIYSILTEVLNDLLFLDVPEDESSPVTACHQKFLEDRMWGQYP